MKRILLTLIIFAFAATACASETDRPITDIPSQNPTTDNPPNPSPGDYAPNPGDSSLTRGNAHLDSTQLITMESYPLQFALSLKGYLPTPCNKLRIAVSPPDVDKKISLDVYSVIDPTTICVQMTQPFDVNFPLGSYPTGHYTLWVNNQKIAEFDA